MGKTRVIEVRYENWSYVYCRHHPSDDGNIVMEVADPGHPYNGIRGCEFCLRDRDIYPLYWDWSECSIFETREHKKNPGFETVTKSIQMYYPPSTPEAIAFEAQAAQTGQLGKTMTTTCPKCGREATLVTKMVRLSPKDRGFFTFVCPLCNDYL